MTDINLTQEKYDSLVEANALLKLTQTNLAAETEAKQAAQTKATEAEANFATEKAAKEKAEADLEAEKAAKVLVDAELTAANAKIAIYANGGKPEGSANPAGGDTESANLAATNILPESFYKA